MLGSGELDIYKKKKAKKKQMCFKVCWMTEAIFFIFIIVCLLLKPEKQVSAMPENLCIHFLFFISMEDKWRRVLRSGGHELQCVSTYTDLHVCMRVFIQFQACLAFLFQQLPFFNPA